MEKNLLTDAEINLRVSAAEKFKATNSSICFFHRAQAMYKNLAKHKLQNLYNEKYKPGAVGFRTLFIDLIVIAFLPVELVAVTQHNLFKEYKEVHMDSTHETSISTFESYNLRQ